MLHLKIKYIVKMQTKILNAKVFHLSVAQILDSIAEVASFNPSCTPLSL